MKEKVRKEKKENPRRKRNNTRNRVAMVSVTFVVAVLLMLLLLEGSNLRRKIDGYKTRETDIQKKIAQEEQREEEIDELKDYMETDEYAEEAAREKLGLVKDNEIVFKEEE